MSTSDKLAVSFGLLSIVPIVLLTLWIDSPLYEQQPTTARWNRLSRRKISRVLAFLAFCFWLAAGIFDTAAFYLLMPVYFGVAMLTFLFSPLPPQQPLPDQEEHTSAMSDGPF